MKLNVTAYDEYYHPFDEEQYQYMKFEVETSSHGI